MLIYLGLLAMFTAFAVLIAGLLAFIRNTKGAQNRWFFIVTIFIALWIGLNFYDSNFVIPSVTETVLRFEFVAALFIAWSVLGFSRVLQANVTDIRKSGSGEQAVLVGLLVANLLFSLLIVSGGVVNADITDGVLNVEYTNWFFLYVLVLFAYFGYALVRLLIRRRVIEDRSAINTIFFGVFIAFVANTLSNLIFPFLINNRQAVEALNIVGYLGLVIFVFSLFIAITRQRLFDIKLVVARSLAYLLSLAVLAGIYGLVIFGISQTVFNIDISVGAQIFLATSTGILGLAFQPFRRVFDNVTTHIFYQDAYDPQKLFDQLNKVLVSSLDVGYLMRHSSAIISSTLKSEFCVINLNRGDRLFGENADILAKKKKAMRVIRFESGRVKHNSILDDSLGQNHIDLRQAMADTGVALIVKIGPGRLHTEGMGEILLGFKKSGNPYNDQDFRNLEAVANVLVLAIQNALRFEEIQRFNELLQEKVEEATRKLRDTNQKLRELDDTKDDFISMASHQLRTPLTSVKGYLSMVLEGDAGKVTATQKKMLGQAFTSSQRMVYLIADLLNVSRLKTGKFVIDAHPTNLAEMVQEEIIPLTESANARGIDLKYHKPANFPAIDLDETKTRQVIMNFIDNAIYYTPSGGHIEVQLEDTPTSYELKVVDDGIGVPKVEQHHLFTKFYRAGNARKARPDGTGLGLFMAKKVILAQGGSIIFESREGKGSTFGFLFPKKHHPASKPLPVATTGVKQP
ncbi:hypothetical protein KDA23_00680 [Candidatus Saccharibacteria bacterium]|nr:hypothetical protein [Candidatus Saccharibacteria bacterium]